jgi:nuclear GTP-binding protein
LKKRYSLDTETTWSTTEEFLSILARRLGKLSKGGEPNIQITARTVLYDWQRGKIPYFVPPPNARSYAELKKGKANNE